MGDTTGIEEYYRSAAAAGTGFPGQLDEGFQARLVDAYADVPRADCDFYHTLDFGDGAVFPGVWDLRGGERPYLGYVDVAGQRVLEMGPATGHLSFFMERQGADVVCFDVAPGVPTEIVPQEGHDIEAQRRLSVGYSGRVRNSWWYARTRFGARCKPVYGDIYQLPPDLRRFDVAILGSILMHLAKPFHALEQVASLTDKAIVVTEPIPSVPADEDAALLQFVPADTAKSVVVWWQLTPGAVIRMLRILGFLEFTVHYHVQKHHAGHELDTPAVDSLMFTVVAERHPGWGPKLERTSAEVAADEELGRSRPDGAARAIALEAEIESLQRSASWRLTRPLRAVGGVLRRLGLR